MGEAISEPKIVMPVWGGILGLLAMVGLVWVLFSLGASAGDAATDAAKEGDHHAGIHKTIETDFLI